MITIRDVSGEIEAMKKAQKRNCIFLDDWSREDDVVRRILLDLQAESRSPRETQERLSRHCIGGGMEEKRT